MSFDEDELKSLYDQVEDKIKIRTKELEELMRMFNNLKGIRLNKAKENPKVVGAIPMSDEMRKEIMEAVKHVSKEQGIKPK